MRVLLKQLPKEIDADHHKTMGIHVPLVIATSKKDIKRGYQNKRIIEAM